MSKRLKILNYLVIALFSVIAISLAVLLGSVLLLLPQMLPLLPSVAALAASRNQISNSLNRISLTVNVLGFLGIFVAGVTAFLWGEVGTSAIGGVLGVVYALNVKSAWLLRQGNIVTP